MMQCLIVILLLIGSVSAVSNIPNLGTVIILSLHVFIIPLLSSAPLRLLEETDKTIAEEYIVIFKKTASEIDGQCIIALIITLLHGCDFMWHSSRNTGYITIILYNYCMFIVTHNLSPACMPK